MIGRRDLMLGALGLGALGAAEALRPRKRLMLLHNTTIAETIPETFGPWQAEASSGLISPSMAGRLARTLYSEIVPRVYFHKDTGEGVMLLAAYGDTQSDLLQLHRPESCYPAVGFALKSAQTVTLAVAHNAILPARRVVAATEERVENIFYWTRMGEDLPTTGGEQRNTRLINAMHGFVADGILVRCSMVGDTQASFNTLDQFVAAMLSATPAARLPALVGTRLARQIA
jgi:EpsI family protein